MSHVKQLREQLRRFAFQDAFVNTLGWNRSQRPPFSTEAQGRECLCTPIAEAGGFVAVEVSEPAPPDDAAALTRPGAQGLRRALANKVTAVLHAHLLIFVDAGRTDSIWQCSPLPGSNRLPAPRRYGRDRPTAPLVALLRNLEIPYDLLDDEGEVSHSEMLDRVAASGALADRVTSRFFRKFSDLRQAFEPFLAWVADEQERSWYITTLLNRLMFLYFIQEKGLLPANYLKTKLDESPAGGDRFYHDFFLPLCFLGLGQEQGKRGPYEALFADVPYLDGGLFTPHRVETEHGITLDAVRDRKLPPKVNIPDTEFKRWFTFLGEWRWPLDEENIENEGQINPGVLGYIFEQYINKKQMGAYYTKEDITGYICRNTIIPRLFDMLAVPKTPGAKAVDPLPIGPHPNLLNNGGGISYGEGIDRYVYPAVKEPGYLPTENDREYEARQKRYQEILQDFDDGKIRTVNDFITYNLDIERMAGDFVASIQDAAVLHALYFECVRRITVLDPTCGSGAFLFAALKILYPLYEGCLVKMAELCGRLRPHAAPIATWKGEFAFANEVDPQLTFIDPGTATDAILADFAAELDALRPHPREYYIHKSIIVNNLFGVDLMDEAVEICKLRLFLKLIAHAHVDRAKKNWGIEPLPDIDFNILAGNTLVGYAHNADVARLPAELNVLPFGEDLTPVYERCVTYGLMVQNYRDGQLGRQVPVPVTKSQIQEYANRKLRPKLDEALLDLYTRGDLAAARTTPKRFRKTHHPFHWFVEFPLVMRGGGFDVVAGNPPWVEYAKVRREQYSVCGFETQPCGNLYALASERSLGLLQPGGHLGFIVQLPLVSAERMATLRRLLCEHSARIHVATFDDRPDRLFPGLEHCRATVFFAEKKRPDNPTTLTIHTTTYQRWYQQERTGLIPLLAFYNASGPTGGESFAKVGCVAAKAILAKLMRARSAGIVGAYTVRRSSHFMFYQEATQYWAKGYDRLPFYEKNGEKGAPPHGRYLRLPSERMAAVASTLLNSSTFYLWFILLSDCYHLSDALLSGFPCPPSVVSDGALSEYAQRLRDGLDANAEIQTIKTKAGDTIRYAMFRPREVKPIIDEIDRVLAKHYGFTEEELDFILHYDIKYRMGGDTGEAE